ncbi:MAG: phosphoribosylanthranilate isomerase [Ectothiorhodospiraceae bacterium]|jgi:phosphoribosylanthranilate isomerase|nr:phosphoribosylanthranilate isomerase [Ectothiorhodospiraceae bacterium]
MLEHPYRTRVKICGITRVEDGLAAVAAGADAIGLVFYPASPRAVGIEQAAAICAALPPFVAAVGLFVDAAADQIVRVLAQVPLSTLQFHGSEQSVDCARFNRPYIKALRMREHTDVEAEQQRFGSAQALLLDTYRAGTPGGTGETFDWGRIPPASAGRIVLAGGLNPDNVGLAVQAVRPYAVDVSGGVESAPGIKDHARVGAFIAAVRRADQSSRGSR